MMIGGAMKNKQLIFVTGGARSGKSSFAEKLASKFGSDKVTYLATAQVFDHEMADRVKRHQEQRPSNWITLEEPLDVCRAMDLVPSDSKVVLLDCLSLLVSNLLFKYENYTYEEITEKVLRDVLEVVNKAKQLKAQVIVVSNEVGMSIVPENYLARLYRDLLGWANQKVAEQADQVFLVTAGIPIELKAIMADPF